jgi:hypothetical protein
VTELTTIHHFRQRMRRRRCRHREMQIGVPDRTKSACWRRAAASPAS